MQISDLHLDAAEDNRDSLLAVLATAQQSRYWPADAIAVTGDIAADENDPQLMGFYQDLIELLQPLAARVCLIPGNHDAPELLAQAVSGYGPSKLSSSNNRADTETANNEQYPEPFMQPVQLGAWRLIPLDTTRPNQTGGYLHADELRRLDTILAASGGHHDLVLLHHPPIALGSAWMDSMQIKNADTLFSRLDQSTQVKAVIWGHAHQEYNSKRHIGSHELHLLGAPATCTVQYQPLSQDFAVDTVASAGGRWLCLAADGSIDTEVFRIS